MQQHHHHQAFANMQIPQVGAILMDAQNISPETAYSDIISSIEKYPQIANLKESIAERLLDDIGSPEQGRNVVDSIAPQTHKHSQLYVSPFDRPSVGSNVIVTTADPNTDEIYVLLGQKKHSDEYLTFGGYMEVHAADGATNPNAAFDNTLADCAKRELQEESSIILPKDYQPDSLGLVSKYDKSGDKNRHSLTEHFHVNLIGDGNNLPQIKGRDDIKSESVRWVKSSDILATPEVGEQTHESKNSRYHVMVDGQWQNIRDYHGEAIEAAVNIASQSMDSLRVGQPAGNILATEQIGFDTQNEAASHNPHPSNHATPSHQPLPQLNQMQYDGLVNANNLGMTSSRYH